MVKAIALLSVATTLLFAPSTMPKKLEKKPERPGNGTIIVGILPNVSFDNSGINYEIEGETNEKAKNELLNRTTQTADDRYNELKSKLDERFQYMFELKAEIESQQNSISSKWEEYNILRHSYERQLKRIVADWVMNQSY